MPLGIQVPPPVAYTPTDDQLFVTDQEGGRKPNAEFLKHHFLHEGRLTELQALYILDQATILLSHEPNLVDVESPVISKSYMFCVTSKFFLLIPLSDIVVCGDICGQYVSAKY